MKLTTVYSIYIRTLIALSVIFSSLVFAPVSYAQELAPPSVSSGSSSVLTPLIQAQEPSTNSASVNSDSLAQPADPAAKMLGESYQAFMKGELDTALDKASEIIKLNSRNKQAHLLRASIYARQQQWDKADYDYEMALVTDPADAIVKFDLAELKFMQKKYDEARPGFALLQSDKDLGDFATYKVLLCDLFGAHEDIAAKDLEAINKVGGNPSYYFGNAAWDLVHNKTDDAGDWLKSASRIYANYPQKYTDYTLCLKSLGYLPLNLTSAQ
jgi:tetratricopeptide (TPR) repeat protein